MKNMVKFLGIIALVAVIGFTFALSLTGCDNGSGGGGGDPLNGTWNSADGEKIVLNNGGFTLSDDNVENLKGTYTASGNNITMTITQVKGSVLGDDAPDIGISTTQWYTQQSMKTAILSYFVELGLTREQAEAVYNQEMEPLVTALFGTITGTLNGNTLALTFMENTTTYTKEGGTTPGTPTPGGLIGLWKSSMMSSYWVEFKPDGELSANGFSGTYTINGNKITITYILGSFTATYSLSGNGNILTLTISVGNPLPSGSYVRQSGTTQWTVVESSIFDDYIRNIIYGNNMFIATSDNKMATSPDGVIWTPVADSTFGTSGIYAIAYGSNMFVAVGYQGKMAYSSNGTTWTAIPNNKGVWNITSWSNQTINDIAYGGGKFVAVGDRGIMATSADGINWEKVEGKPFESSSNDIYRIAYGNNMFIAWGRIVSGGKIVSTTMTSANGVTWTSISNTDFYPNRIAFCKDRFFAVSNEGKMEYSTNGANWTPIMDGEFWAYGTDYDDGEYLIAEINDITYGNGKFIAVGDSGTMATSTDGTNWTQIIDSTLNMGILTPGITAIAYGNGKFVFGNNNGKIAYSSGL